MFVSIRKKKRHSRCSIDIVRDILTVAKGKAKKTQIMYQANLNFNQVEKYIKLLCENCLLDHDENYYSATEKGLEFLMRYDNYIDQCRLIAENVDRSNRARGQLERMFRNNSNK